MSGTQATGGFSRHIHTRGWSLYWLAALCLLLGPWVHSAEDVFALQRSALEDGELWRVWTGHLVHTSWQHLGLSLAALIVLQQLFGDELSAPVWTKGFLIIAVGIGVGWFFISDFNGLPFLAFDTVTGLSGVLHGLFALGACLALRRDKVLGIIVLAGVGTKVAWEQINGPSDFTAELIKMPVASDVHLYGFFGGLILGAILLARD